MTQPGDAAKKGGGAAALIIAILATWLAFHLNKSEGFEKPDAPQPTGTNGQIANLNTLPHCDTEKRPQDCYNEKQIGWYILRIAPLIWNGFYAQDGSNPNINLIENPTAAGCGYIGADSFKFCQAEKSGEVTFASPKTAWRLYSLWPSDRNPFPKNDKIRPGEVAVDIALAHEFYHRMQKRNGQTYKHGSLPAEDSADCWAGVYYSTIRKQREADGAAAQDDKMLPDLFARINVDADDRHYKEGERWGAFTTGWRKGGEACNKAYPEYAWRR